MKTELRHKLCAEFFGTMSLLIVVVGSGIMGESLAQGNQAIALLANSIATGAGLYVLIFCLQGISAQFNPAVSLVEYLGGKMSKSVFFLFLMAQCGGAIVGVALAHAMFAQDIVQISQRNRYGFHLSLSEFLATAGLLLVILFASERNLKAIPSTVALYIVAAYWFTSSTSFANPAVTIGRIFTNTFSGVSPGGAVYFVASQFIAAASVACFAKIRGGP